MSRALAIAVALALHASLHAQFAAQFAAPPEWRALGPGNTSGRIVDLAVDPSDHDVWYVATASGGLWRTTNGGTTFTPVFEREATISLGAVAVSPSAAGTVWIGTGEANARNSVSWGDGVYVSRDAGATWTHAGLRESAQIGRIAAHPTDAGVVLVAACGRLWGPNAERGVFRTRDGGKSWQHVLAVDADTGAVDVLFDPKEPERAYAATWTRRRDAFDGNDPAVRWGPGSGIWRSDDGGATWKRLTAGLPTCAMGRIGLSLCLAKAASLYAVIETERVGQNDGAATGGEHKHASFLGGQKENVQGEQGEKGFETGGVFRSDDGGDNWTRVNSLNPRPYYYAQIRVDPQDVDRVYVLGPNFHRSTDGGKTFAEVGDHRLHPDFHAMWIDPADPTTLLIGNDGGVARSADRGATWRFFENLPCAQFYRVAVDDSLPYRIVGGLQDNGTWLVPSRTRHSDGIRIGDVFNLGWGDGFTALPHPVDLDFVWFTSQYGAIGWRNLRSGETGGVERPKLTDGEALRFQWDTPYAVAHKEPDVLWIGAQRVIRATERGKSAEFASPELTTHPQAAITALAVSTKVKGELWAGTADGRVWLTKNAGKAWKEVTGDIQDAPAGLHVADLESSHADGNVAWLAFDGHRSDDTGVHLFRTTNGGRTWKRIGSGIDRGPVLALQQGTHNEDLLFAGTEFGAFVSLDAGDSFTPLRGNLPTVAVRDFAIQERERELVAATHGRGLFVLDVAGLEGLTKKARAKDLAILDPVRAVTWTVLPHRLAYGDGAWAAPNPPLVAAVHVWIGASNPPALELEILEKTGPSLRTLPVPRAAGLHRIAWDLRRENDQGPRVGPGTYTVRLKGENVAIEGKLDVVADPWVKPVPASR
ncbi:MAG: hypothetical protein HZB39_19735 [Planctomycetes bacterium]|nr:hypothetical protein [Planctomycetota bacterium]